jgi:5-methylcytosine-specific restriction endonuclease McrA
MVEDIKVRDNYTCQRCGKTIEESNSKGDRAHHVHHIVPFAKSERLQSTSDNLILLCERCHSGFVHTNENVNLLYMGTEYPKGE